MSRFVLVHGAWHGGWCWEKVIPCLQRAGHEILAPDLPGHGDNQYPPADITLSAYTHYVRETVEQISGGVILVGHSMAGIVISSVAELIPDKISRLVYLTAFLLRDGESMLEVTQKDTDSLVLPNLVYSRDRRSATVRDNIVADAFYNGCAEADIIRAKSRLVPEPLAPIATPVHVTENNWGRVPRSYIECTRDRAISPALQRQMQVYLPCAQVLQMDTGHSPFISEIDDLAGKLDWLAQQDG